MHPGIAARDLDRLDRVPGGERPHRHHHAAVEPAGRRALDVGEEHRADAPVLPVPDPEPGIDQGLLEREGAAEGEGHEIVLPQVPDAPDVPVELAVAEHAVAREVGPKVEVLPELRQARVARLGHREERTGFRVALAETGELVRVVTGQDGEVGLDEALGEGPGVSAVLPGANAAPHLDGVRGVPVEAETVGGLHGCGGGGGGDRAHDSSLPGAPGALAPEPESLARAGPHRTESRRGARAPRPDPGAHGSPTFHRTSAEDPDPLAVKTARRPLAAPAGGGPVGRTLSGCPRSPPSPAGAARCRSRDPAHIRGSPPRAG